MCMSCGCKNVNDKHGNKDNLTMEDIKKAANAAKIQPEECMKNIQESLELAKTR